MVTAIEDWVIRSEASYNQEERPTTSAAARRLK